MGKYFTVDELAYSATAMAKRIDNTMPTHLRANAQALIDNVLDPLREAWGKPIYVNSGYRSPALNKAVGGAKNSHHMLAMAADITAGNQTDNRKLFQLVLSLGLPFTQLIDERGFAWVHVSYDAKCLKKQVLKM